MKLTKCPQCAAQHTNETNSCEICGLVFRKYFKYYPQQAPEQFSTKRTDQSKINPEDIISTYKDNSKNDYRTIKFGFIALLTYFSVVMLFAGINGESTISTLMHLIALPFHEAGHVLLRPAGQFISSLGGTLGQLTMPLICAVVLWVKQGDRYGSMIACWWLGQNFIDISPYIYDARAGQLPLLGGNFGHSSPYGFHDWEYLLTETGLISADHTIASISFALGIVVMLSALGFACYFNSKSAQ
jgi:hypothetical protein